MTPLASLTLHPIDAALVVLYLLAVAAIGLWLSRGVKTGKDLFLGGRSLPWWAVGTSLVVSDIGAKDMVGLADDGYRYGMVMMNFDFIGCIFPVLVAAFLFMPYLWLAGVYTIPEYLGRRYNRTVRTLFALIWGTSMVAMLATIFVSAATMFEHLLGWNFYVSIGILTVLVGVYTTLGGLKAVVFTDFVSCIVLIVGASLICIVGMIEVGGWSELQRRVSELPGTEHHFKLVLPADAPQFSWPSVLLGLGFVAGPAYWIGNQAIVQRSLGARSAFEAQAAYIWGALLKNLIPVIIVLPGLVAFALLPDLTDGDTALPLLAMHLLPVGMRGIFVAAFLAALMSSVDSYLNAAATIFTHDFYERIRAARGKTSHPLSVGRITTLVLVAWAIGFALWISTIEDSGIYVIFQTLMAFFQGPALAILLLGVFWRRATAAGAFVGFVGGVACAVGLFLLNYPPILQWLDWQPLFRIEEPFLYFSVWAFLVAALLTAGVSWLTKAPPQEQIEPLLFRSIKPCR